MTERNASLCRVSEPYKRIYLSLTYSLIFVLGLALNGAILWRVCRQAHCWSCWVVYLANLALADLLYVLALPLLIASYAMNDVWPFGDVACRAMRFFFYTNLHCSMTLLTCISVHRCLGVCYPIKAIRLRTKRVAVLVSGLVWALVAVEISPTMLFTHSGFINNMTVCFDMASPDQYRWYFPYGMFLAVAGFLFPFLVVIVCYCHMMKVLSGGDASPQLGRVVRTKTVRTLLIVCSLFVLSFGPYYLSRTIYLLVRVYLPGDCRVLNVVMVCYKVWRPLVSFNCCVNPILYIAGSDRKRKRLWGQLRRRKVSPSVWTVQPRPAPSQKTASGAAPTRHLSIQLAQVGQTAGVKATPDHLL